MSAYDIKLDRVSFTYPKGRTTALKDISIDIPKGQFLCVTGPSGSGKSTFLRLLAALEQPKCGSIMLGDRTVSSPGADRVIVFQDYTLFPWLTVRKNVIFGIEHSQKSKKKDAASLADGYLSKVGMLKYKDMYPYQLSGGMKQRTAIARALAMDSRILLLDEPFGALDEKNRRILQEFIVKLWEGGGEDRKTVIFVTHDIKEAVKLGQRIIYIENGSIRNEISVDMSYPREDEKGMKKYISVLSSWFGEDSKEGYE